VRGTLATSGLVFLIGFGFVTWRWAIQRRQVLAYQRLAVQELQDARQMQMSLLPKTPPVIEGMEIAGTCVPANTVSGDFYNYISLEHEMTAIVLADVTGKGMKGAMNAVLSYGVLHAEAKLALSPSQMLGVLNRDLYGRFQERTNCAMCLAAVNPKERRLQYANAGIPYPIVKQGGKVFELELNGMPLGGFRSATYQEMTLELQTGDVVVFFSDGVTESPSATEPDKLYMETDRLFSLIARFDEQMTAQAMIDAILADVVDFSGDRNQSDDRTIVVIKVL
jgi:sigma-B regulation protein RsbU (phosphoserine phosphatase)